MMVTSLQFLVSYTMFWLFAVILVGQMGVNMVSAGFGNIAPPVCNEGFLGTMTCVLTNLGFFFTLMSVSVEFGIFGILLTTPLLVGVGWAILSMIRGTGS